MKVKHTTKKSVSLLLAIIMLLGMIPMGVITISASTVNYTIDNVESWNTIHNMSWTEGNTFGNMVIEISQDIEITSEFKLPLFKIFEGTLQGVMQSDNKYSEIKAAEGTPLTTDAVIALQTKGTVAVRNLVFNGIDMYADASKFVASGISPTKSITLSSATGIPYAIVVADNYSATGTFENLTFSNCDMTANSYSKQRVFEISGTKYHNMMGGFLVGYSNNAITVRNVTIENSSAKTSDSAGLLVGWTANNVSVDGITIKDSAMNVWSVDNGNTYCGGVVGRAGNSSVIDIKNVEMDKFHMVLDSTKAHVNGLVVGNAAGSLCKIVGANVKNSSLTAKDASTKDASKIMGGIVGAIAGKSSTDWDTLQNVTVEGLTVTGNASNGTLGGLVGLVESKNSNARFLVSGITIKGANVTNNSAYAGGIVGKLLNGREDTFEYINISGLKLKGTSAAINLGSGGVIGVYTPCTDNHTLNINNVSIKDSSITDYNVGGVIGVATKVTRAQGSTAGEKTDAPVTHNINVSNVYMDATLEGTSRDGSNGAGGIFGLCGERNSGGDSTDDKKQTRVTNLGTINVESCVIQGSITAPKRAAGIAAYYGYMASKFHVNNCLIAPTTIQGADGIALIAARGLRLWDNVEIKVSDCISNTDKLPVACQFHGEFTYNGESYSGNGKSYDIPYVELTCGFILAERGEGDKELYILDDDGFVSLVRGHVSSGYWQGPRSAVANGETYNLRMVAITMIDIPVGTDFGLKIKVKTADGNTLIHDYSGDELEFVLYDVLTGYEDDGNLTEYRVTDFGGKKFIAAVLTGIPAGEAYLVEVTPYVGAVEYVTHSIVVGVDGQPAK